MENMRGSVLREVTPLSEQDCFMIFSRVKDHFAFPLHVHKEFELNFIENASGARRVVGDSVEEIEDIELTLIANANLEHGWFDPIQPQKEVQEIKEITIQFHDDLLSSNLLQRNQFHSVKEMLDKALYGITFPTSTAFKLKNQIRSLASEHNGAHSVLKLMSILYDLSLSESRELSSRSFNNSIQHYDSRRIERVYNYMMKNYNQPISLSDVANLIGMTEVSFSRFLKKRTGRNFIDSLNDIRLGHATRMLLDTTHSIAEISIQCGFNNLSNFNRIFKKKKQCTPREFRENYNESRFFL